MNFLAQSQPGSEDSESEDDIDYKPEEEWKKVTYSLLSMSQQQECFLWCQSKEITIHFFAGPFFTQNRRGLSL
jgi:hypothetical protein